MPGKGGGGAGREKGKSALSAHAGNQLARGLLYADPIRGMHVRAMERANYAEGNALAIEWEDRSLEAQCDRCHQPLLGADNHPSFPEFGSRSSKAKQRGRAGFLLVVGVLLSLSPLRALPRDASAARRAGAAPAECARTGAGERLRWLRRTREVL